MTEIIDLYGNQWRLKRGLSFAGKKIHSHAQALQDVFALCVANELPSLRTYLEVGAHQPISFNNSFTLSSQYGWRGVSIELDTNHAVGWRSNRPDDRIWFTDALTLDYDKVLKDVSRSARVGYLQLDIDPSSNTLLALRRVLESIYRFSAITFETDAYTGDLEPQRESRRILTDAGYHLFAADVIVEFPPSSGKRVAFEDWWVDLRDDETSSNSAYFRTNFFEGLSAAEILCEGSD